MPIKAKREAMQRIERPDKTGSNGVDDKDLGIKPGKDELIVRKGVPQLDVHELELQQQPVPQKRKQETQRHRIPRKGHRRRCRISKRGHKKRQRIPRGEI